MRGLDSGDKKQEAEEDGSDLRKAERNENGPEEILNTVGVSDQDVYVTCEGRMLRKEEQLQSCGVRDGSTIQVTSRMRGGGDDFSWSSSDLFIRLYFLVSVRHRHRCERTFSQNTKETLNSSCIFKVLRFARSNHFFRRSLQIGPQTSHCPFLFARFQASSKPQRCRFTVSKSQNISIQDRQHHCYVAGHTATPLNPMTSMSLCHAAPLPCTTRV